MMLLDSIESLLRTSMFSAQERELMNASVSDPKQISN